MQREKVPPVVPTELEELRRAIVLLGSRVKADLRHAKRAELVRLVGAYPDKATAAAWKQALQSIPDDELFYPAD